MVRRSSYGSAARGSPELRTYAAWRNLKTRCDNRRSPKYRHYGGRGIRYDAKWKSFAGFVDDMGLAPPGMSLDRIDNDGPYRKSNCRWATPKQQNRNARFNRIIEFAGERKPLSAWAEQLGIKWFTLRARLDMGWPLERALSPGKFNRAGKCMPNRKTTTEPRVKRRRASAERRPSVGADPRNRIESSRNRAVSSARHRAQAQKT
jgi:hypothetical protein